MTLRDPLPTADAPTLSEFLLARIAEDEAEVDHPLFEGSTARVLRECEAKRRIVEEHAEDHKWCGNEVYLDPDYEGCRTLRYLAAVYSDHPDYQQEWKL